MLYIFNQYNYNSIEQCVVVHMALIQASGKAFIVFEIIPGENVQAYMYVQSRMMISIVVCMNDSITYIIIFYYQMAPYM